MGSCVGIVQHLHLATVVMILVVSSLALGHGLVHLVARIDDGLHILLLQVLFSQLGYLLVGYQLATGEDGLRELSYEVEQ